MSYRGKGPGDLARARLEQDMDAMLEADVEYFDHPALGRIRLRDHLVRPPEMSIEAEQQATADGEFP